MKTLFQILGAVYLVALFVVAQMAVNERRVEEAAACEDDYLSADWENCQ